MSNKMVKILYRHPNRSVRELSPKVLEWDDHKKERHFFEPSIVAGKVVYEVPEPYGRLLLSRQPERYFLLEPKKLMCKFPSRDGLSSETRMVDTVLGSSKFKDFESVAESEQKEKEAAQKVADREADDLALAEMEAAEKAQPATAKKTPAPSKAAPQGAGPGNGVL